MAAGLGSRLRPFSDHVTKPLIPVMGVPCAQFAIDGLVVAGVARVVANIHHLADATRAGLSELDLLGSELLLSDESSELLGSGGGIAKALPLLGKDPFFISNADALCSLDWAALGRAHQRLRSKWGVALTLAVMPIPRDAEEPYRELKIDATFERLRGLGEKTRDGSRDAQMYIGCAVVEPELLATLPGDKPFEFVPSILLPAIASGRAGVHRFEGWWLDVGSPATWWRAHMKILAGLETGQVPEIWRERIERTAKRVAPQCWVSRRARPAADPAVLSAPLYWDPLAADAGRSPVPHALGPGAVVYGEAPSHAEGPGIGAFGLWSPQGER